MAVRHRERLLFRPGREKCKAIVSPEMIIAPAHDMRAFGQLPKLSQSSIETSQYVQDRLDE